MTEDELLAGLTDALELTGWTYVHLGGDLRGKYRGDPGWPDLFAIAPDGSRALAWELKTDRGIVRWDQVRWLRLLWAIADDLRRVLLDVRVIRSADYDAAVAWIVRGDPIPGGRTDGT